MCYNDQQHFNFSHHFIEFGGKRGTVCVIYQPEGAQHAQPLHIGQAELHEAEADNDAVEDVPARLEVVVRIQSDDLQHHLCCEDPGEHLKVTQRGM